MANSVRAALEREIEELDEKDLTSALDYLQYINKKRRNVPQEGEWTQANRKAIEDRLDKTFARIKASRLTGVPDYSWTREELHER